MKRIKTTKALLPLDSKIDHYVNNENDKSEGINQSVNSDNDGMPLKKRKKEKADKKLNGISNDDRSTIVDDNVSSSILRAENKKRKKERQVRETAEPPPDSKALNSEEDQTEPEQMNQNRREEKNTSDDDEVSTTKLSSKEINEISANYLRSSFKTASGLSILRKFVTICSENTERELASEYIEKSGNVFEILRLLEGCDSKNLNNVALVFSGMHIVIMKILEKYPQNIGSAQEACHHFINVYVSTIHAMMSKQSTPKQRKIVLRLLASIVSLGGTLPRELLAHLSFHAEIVILMCQQTKPTDPQSVRTCFIHFILSFLVDSRASVIRGLLEKRGLLASIFPQLIYDSHLTVHLVLNTIKTYVLENSAVTKTLKLQVFSTPVVQNLVSLYNWKGPKNWPGFENKKRKSLTGSVDPEERALAIETVHDFLLVLLTSSRYGIIFNDKTLGTTGKKCNQLANTILQSLEKPWEHEKPCDLVLKILAACPDLIKHQLAYTQPFLEPRPSTKWMAVMDFIKRVLEAVDPEHCFKASLPQLTSSQLVNATLTLTMPSIVLKHAVVPSLHAPCIILRHEALITLTIMLNQIRKFLNVAEKNVSTSEYSNLQSHVRDYVLKNLPSVQDILKVWRDANESDENVDAVQEILLPRKSKHFACILDLLRCYLRIFPEYIRSNDLEELKEHSQALLTSLNALEDVSEEELKFMKLQAIQIIQLLNPKIFEPREQFLANTLLFLLPLQEDSSDKIKFEGTQTIKSLLQASKIFEKCEDQIDIWLNSLNLLKNSEERTEVSQWLVKIIPKAAKHAVKYQGLIENVEKTAENTDADVVRTEKPPKIETNLNKSTKPTASIPAILCASFDNLKKHWNETAGKFIGFITVLTLHCQVSPNTLIEMSKDIPGRQLEYLNSWRVGETPMPLKKILSKNIVGRFSKHLLTSEVIEFDRILSNEDGSISNYEFMNLVRMTVFYLTQFIQRGELTEKRLDQYKQVIIKLFDFNKCSSKEKYDSNSVIECTRYILIHPILLNSFNPVAKIQDNTAKIVTIGLVEIFEKIVDINEESDIQDLLVPFKNKLMSLLKVVLRKCAGGWALRTTHCLLKYISILQLKSSDLQEILKSLTNLPREGFLTEDKKTLSIWGQVVPRLMELLSEKKNLEMIAQLSKETQMVHKVFIYFTHLKCTRLNIESWENSLYKFLNAFPHLIAVVDLKTFNSLLENELGESTIRLICFLTERNPKLIPPFTKHVSSDKILIGHPKLIFGVLSSNLTYKWSSEFLSKINQQYEQNIIEFFLFSEKSQDWLNQNVDAVTYLINACFSLEVCEGISRKSLSSGDKLETVDLNYTKLLYNLFLRISQLHQNPQEILTQTIQVLIRLSVTILKKNTRDEERIEILCKYISETVTKLKSFKKNIILEELSKSYSWPQFTRFSLRSGLKNLKSGSTKVLSLLKTLSEVCDIAYEDESQCEYVKTLFEMITSHSEFVNLMLSSQDIKQDLLRLIFILIKKNSTIMTSSHIPLYLSAYNASLSQSDKQILLILQHYECSGIKLTEYKPYLFGEAAASHHNVRGRTDTAIWRQPSNSQVLQLFNMDMVRNTIINFPVERTLQLNELPCDKNVYDPAFYLPLLTHLLADNNMIECHNVTQSGALALVFAACGSTCQEIRMSALTILSRFYFHLEATRSKEKLLWMRMIDVVRNAIASLDCPLTNVRLNCFVSTFLAKSSLIATQPLNPLYAPLHNFFMAKPELDLRTIPEFLTLFNSSHINHKVHRHWILEVVRDGLKTNFDMEIASRFFLFRMLFYVYGSVLTDADTKTLILQVIKSAVTIPKAALFLCHNSELLVWLNVVASEINSRDNEGFELIIEIVRTLLDTLLSINDRNSHIQFMLLEVLKILIPKLSRNTKVSCYSKLLRSLEEILKNKSLCTMIHKDQIQRLVEISMNIVGDVQECAEILIYKCEFVGISESIDCNDELDAAKVNLRNIVILWRTQIKS
ncbi:nucleolar pre-ribosomal-associated protein 1 [Fopius arisanus]|uniref:Nucleolar pre-ribosomal-associated protein 1 n=2 Tax=Fopius arisanus TaxID=64838 RepID=A0A9R1SZ18_9HYME|nr:PREDICTED: nucleolar pre-ribosomal-associated protein 1 [Fopius arisanus]